MLFMPWDTAFETGITEIDQQHRWLVDTTNELHQLVSSTSVCKQDVSYILERLMDYCMNHFVMEEALFIRLGYPESDNHIAEHNIFCEQIMELLTRHDMGETLGVEAANLLKNWLTHHIIDVDKQYVEQFESFSQAI